jgi:hypothetical protein
MVREVLLRFPRLRYHRRPNAYRKFGLQDRYARRGPPVRTLMWSALGVVVVAGILRLAAVG